MPRPGNLRPMVRALLRRLWAWCWRSPAGIAALDGGPGPQPMCTGGIIPPGRPVRMRLIRLDEAGQPIGPVLPMTEVHVVERRLTGYLPPSAGCHVRLDMTPLLPPRQYVGQLDLTEAGQEYAARIWAALDPDHPDHPTGAPHDAAATG